MNILITLLSAGYVGPVVMALIMVVSGAYIQQSAKNEAEKVARNSYEGAITALRQHIDALQIRIKDAEIENEHLRQTTEIIFKMLKERDIHIASQGHIITIQDGKDITITHIRKDGDVTSPPITDIEH